MIGLVDGNNFYVSCERVFDLSLVGKPVAILSNNDGCVVSRSYEFKSLPIPMGTPYFKLRPYIKSHHIILRSSNYELYGDLSKRIISTLREFALDAIPYSIDESFIRVELPEDSDYTAYGKKIRATVLQWVGIPCGVGFARTYTLAKLANHIGKKRYDGVFTMPDEAGPLLRELPVDEVWGVGRHLAPKLVATGIATAYDLANADEVFLRKRFNVTLAKTSRELRGEPAIELTDCEESPQSISCSRSFGYPVTKQSEIREAIASYVANAARRLREKGKRAAGANIYLQTFQEQEIRALPSSFTGATVTFDIPTAATSEMLKAILPHVERLYSPSRRYRKAGVVFFGLESKANRQLDLFSDTERNDLSEKVSTLSDSLNQRYGKGALFNLSEGIERNWTMKRELLSPGYTTNWDSLPVVK